MARIEKNIYLDIPAWGYFINDTDQNRWKALVSAHQREPGYPIQKLYYSISQVPNFEASPCTRADFDLQLMKSFGFAECNGEYRKLVKDHASKSWSDKSGMDVAAGLKEI